MKSIFAAELTKKEWMRMKRFDIMTIGVPMVEFTRTKMDMHLTEPGEFYGPVPAGDPGIALNACVRLGYRGCYVGAIGVDAFADCFLAQMKRSGINVDYIRRDPDHDTGLSMLTKFSDGSREFFFTVPRSAAATMGPDDLDADLLKNVRWVHLSGFALSISESAGALHHQLIRELPGDVRVSFDPNYRKQVIGVREYLARAGEVLERCDCFLPSRGEAALFGDGMETDEAVCARLSKTGKHVALKDGAKGSVVFDDGERIGYPAFKVRETDSTGAGDIYDGAFIASLMDGKNVREAGRYATAAGAIAVTRVGLMDIAPVRQEIDAMLNG